MKTLFILAISIISYFFVAQVSFANQLLLPDTIKLIELNGQEQSFSFFESSTDVELMQGQNVLVLQYKELFDDYDNDDHTTIKSLSFIVILNNESNKDLSLLTEDINNLNEARNYAKDPQITIIDENQKNIQFFKQELKSYLASNKLPSLTQPAKQSIAEEPKKLPVDSFSNQINVTQINSNTPEALNMLKFWWRQASEQQRAEFLSVIKNDKK